MRPQAQGARAFSPTWPSIAGGDLGPEALERKSARLALRARRGQLTADHATDDVLGKLAREREDGLVVTMSLHRVGDLRPSVMISL